VQAIPAAAADVELLITHRIWLKRADFLETRTFTCTDFDTNQASTGIEWTQAVTGLDQDNSNLVFRALIAPSGR
jgi:hypothetical protein